MCATELRAIWSDGHGSPSGCREIENARERDGEAALLKGLAVRRVQSARVVAQHSGAPSLRSPLK
jgi:hypothetical protein